MHAPIFLIDDNSKGSRNLYGGSYVDNGEFSDILRLVDKLNKDSDLSFLKTAACAMFHDSLEDYVDGAYDEYGHIARGLVKDYIDDAEISFVCFSDGHPSIGEYDSLGNIVSLKKSDFYYRLRFFLEEYRRTGNMVFHILAYGPDFNRVIMTMNIQALLRKFSFKAPAEILSCQDVMPRTSEEPAYLEDLLKFSHPAIGIDYDDLLDLIEDEQITVRHFRAQLTNIMNSIATYGKNTYSWK